MEERFNAGGRRGRDCPVCWRADSLVLARDGSGLLECGGGDPLRSFTRIDGCGTRFRLAGGELVRVREESPGRPLTHDELAVVRGGAA